MNPSCKQIPDLMAEILGDEATAEQQAALENHRTTCASCATEIDELSWTLAQSRRLGVPEPSQEYWAAFGPELRRRLEAPPIGIGLALGEWFRPVLAAAALSWLVIAGLGHDHAAPPPGMTSFDLESPGELSHEVALSFVESLDVVTPGGDELWTLPSDVDLAGDANGAMTGDLFGFTDYELDSSADELLSEIARELAG